MTIKTKDDILKRIGEIIGVFVNSLFVPKLARKEKLSEDKMVKTISISTLSQDPHFFL